MIRRGFNTTVNMKLDYIQELCEKLGLEFDNTIPNKYTVISKTGRYVFSTYGDVIGALELLYSEKK